jgi:hypothetical protein
MGYERWDTKDGIGKIGGEDSNHRIGYNEMHISGIFLSFFSCKNYV